MMETDLRRTWAEINLDHLLHNYRTLRARVGTNVKFLGVVKADAYGHGAVEVSQLLQSEGADYLAVSNLDEARELRIHGIELPILILGHTPPEQVSKLIEYSITQSVSCLSKAREYEAAAARLDKQLKIHVKLDTGMSRLGVLCANAHFNDAVTAIGQMVRLPHLRAEGIFTHFAVSDETDAASQEYTRQQLALFKAVINAVEADGFRFELRHCANTGAVACYPEAWMDMVRPGLLLYGYGEFAGQLGLKPVMRLKTTVSTIKIHDPGTSISYGRLFETTEPTRVGVLPIGYADGFFRCLSNRCSVMTAGGPAPLRGRICMDMCMIDLTNLPDVQVGDEVEIFGDHMPIEQLAQTAGTIPYEMTCAISRRVPRVYWKYGTIIGQVLKMG